MTFRLAAASLGMMIVLSAPTATMACPEDTTQAANKQICDTPSLAKLDAKMREAFSTAYDNLGGKNKRKMRREQRVWTQYRLLCETDTVCIEFRTKMRLQELSGKQSLMTSTGYSVSDMARFNTSG